LNSKSNYWSNILIAAQSLLKGLRITFSHISKSGKSVKASGIASANYFENQKGLITIQYPHVSLPVPDVGRYRLHNEIDDCIVCDKCAKVCPVDCIEIEAIKSPEEIGKTSDGTTKRIHAAKFNIDMGKCCFCGLCTTVCPTECITMTKTYDFSVFDIKAHDYAFAEMSAAQIAESKNTWAKAEAEKQERIANAATVQTENTSEPKPPRPVFKPKMKPPGN
jgi:formate hydrogenlyase subunit 6/NADH:ubiquinone oxidoreductase subunit I